MRKSGIDVVGNIPWGTHICQFYETARDLTDILVPYFKAGLKSNEFCLWVTSSPLNRAAAEKALKKAIPGFDRHVKKGQIEIVPHTQWYLEKGKFSFPRVMDGWVNKLNLAINRGFEGLRATGNTAWLLRKDWKSFIEYEKEINRIIGDLKMIALCSYNLGKCGTSGVIEVANNHHFALIRRDGKWNLIPNIRPRLINQTIQASQEELALVVEASLDAIIAVNEAGNISLFNPAAEELFQYGLDEILLQSVRVLLREDVSEIHHKRLKRFLNKGIGRCGHIGRRTEFTFRRKDGTPFEGELSMSGARVGGKRMIVVSIRDITERKRAEEELRERERKLMTLFEVMPAGVSILDAERRIVYVNPALERILGISRDGLFRGDYKGLTYLKSDGTSMPAKEFASIRAVREQKAVYNAETGIVKEDGNIVWANVSAVPVTFSDWKAVIVTSDITERKRMEEKLKASEEKFRTVFEHSPDYIYVNDLDGKFLEANSAVLKTFDVSLEKLKQQGYLEYFAGDNLDKLLRVSDDLRLGRSVYGLVLKTCNSQGKMIDLEINAVPLFAEGKVASILSLARDITERKRAEEMLRLSEEKYRNLFHNAQVGLFRTRITDGKVVECNDMFAGMLGYKSWEDCLRDYSVPRHFDNPDDQRQLLRKLKESGEARNLETRGVKTDGSPVWVNYSVKMIPGTEYIVGASIDITELKTARENVRAFQERWNQFSNAATDYFFLFDSELNLVDLNRSISEEVEKILPREKAIGKNIAELHPGSNESGLLDAYKNVVKTGNPMVTNAMRLPSQYGENILADIKTFKVGDGLGMILRDVTDQVRAEEKIKNASTAWRTTFDSIPEMIMVLGLDYRIVRANRAMAKYLGLTYSEIIGQQCFRLVHKTGAPPKYCRQAKVVSEGRSSTYEIHSDILGRDYLVALTPMFREGKEVSGVVHITRDITEEKKLQKRLKDSERMAVIGEVAGNIAHEIKNPLFAISSGIEILKGQLKLEGAHKETLEIIMRETVRMDHLVRQLLDYGRHRALDELVLAPVDMREVVEEVVALNSGLLQAQGIRVEKKIPPELPSVMAKKSEMIQVFINLLQNAIEVSGKGDVIEIKARADDNRKTLMVSMKDRGPGILKEMKEKIFEIFFTTKKGSYGMGLAISKRIILDHGGDIRVESEPGKGTEFIVELPIK